MPGIITGYFFIFRIFYEGGVLNNIVYMCILIKLSTNIYILIMKGDIQVCSKKG